MPKMLHLSKPTIRLALAARKLIAKQPYAGARGGAPCLDLRMVNGVTTIQDDHWSQHVAEAAAQEDCLFCSMPYPGLDKSAYCSCHYAPKNVFVYQPRQLKRDPQLRQQLTPAYKVWCHAVEKARRYIDEEVAEREGVRAARKRWRALQGLVASRRVVLYWQERTHAALCAPGGAGRAADLADYAADGFA